MLEATGRHRSLPMVAHGRNPVRHAAGDVGDSVAIGSCDANRSCSSRGAPFRVARRRSSSRACRSSRARGRRWCSSSISCRACMSPQSRLGSTGSSAHNFENQDRSQFFCDLRALMNGRGVVLVRWQTRIDATHHCFRFFVTAAHGVERGANAKRSGRASRTRRDRLSSREIPCS
jgi:hypothetical protein